MANKAWSLRVQQLVAALAVVIGLAAIVFNSASAGTAIDMKPRVRAVYEAMLRRPVTDAELEQILKENAAEYAKFNATNIGSLDKLIEIMRTQAGKPAELHLRHLAIQAEFFENPGKFSEKLVVSMDPIAVSDPRRKQAMTQGDVLALVQLMKFGRTGTDPREIEKTRGLKDAELAAALTTELNNIVKNGGALPEMLLDASAYWAGLLQNWETLLPVERERTRNYTNDNLQGKLTDLPRPLYSRLMGWSEYEINLASTHRDLALAKMAATMQSRLLTLQTLYDSWQHATQGGQGSILGGR
jgi:hypothetical protein